MTTQSAATSQSLKITLQATEAGTFNLDSDYFDTEAAALEALSTLSMPKSAKINVRKGYGADWDGVRFAIRHSSFLAANEVTGERNEAGINRIRKILAKLDTLDGVDVEWVRKHGNGYDTQADFVAAQIAVTA